jgi:hypothetical protein
MTDIQLDSDRAIFQFRGSGLRSTERPTCDRDRRTSLRESSRHRQAEPARPSGDQDARTKRVSDDGISDS